MLNSKQKEFIDLVFNSNHRIILLQGEAGTGKTYTITHLVNKLGDLAQVTATSNKAKDILKQALPNVKVTTIDSARGFILKPDKLNKTSKKVKEHNSSPVLIIDEVSMLKDLIWRDIVKDTLIEKIILVGDEYQLPSIGDYAKIVPDAVITLTEQMRQKKDTKLEVFFNKLRTAIKETKSVSLRESIPDNIILYSSFKDFSKAYLGSLSNKRILAYTNSVVDKYNRSINKGFRVNDCIIIDKPIGTNMYNSQEVIINHITEVAREINGVVIHWKELLITARNNPLNSKIIKVFSSNKDKYLYLKPYIDAKDWDIYHKENDYICNPKHLYASTIHKAQGETIDEVFLDYKDLISNYKKGGSIYSHGISLDLFLRLLYVGISRMRTKCHIFVGNSRDYSLFSK